MPEFEPNSNHIRLEKKIRDYAEAVRQRQIERRKYMKQHGYRFDVNARFPYPYDDNTERRLMNEIDGYLLSLDEKARKEANSRLLDEYQKYLATPFAKHAKELAMRSIEAHPLTDEAKLKFLDYLFTSGKYQDFDKRTLYKLADYNPNAYLEQTNRLYVRALLALGKGAKKKDDDVALIEGMLKVFAEKVDTVPADMAVNYAKIHFRLADKTSEFLTSWFLGKLATKTPQAQTLQQNNAKNLDKNTMEQIFGAYIDHAVQSVQFNHNLSESILLLIQAGFENYNYTPKEAEALISLLREADKKIQVKKKTVDERKSGLNTLAVRLEHLPVNPLAGIDYQSNNYKPTKAHIAGYAQYLCKMAAYDTEKEVRTDDLMMLLQKHAGQHRLDVVEATLFTEASKRKAVDKYLVLEIAKIYAASVNFTKGECNDLNIGFSRRMTEMFKDIVANYNYNGKEARAISNALAQGAGGRNSYFQTMGKEVFNAYNAAYRRRYRAIKGKSL